MKNIISLLFLTISFYNFSQESFDFSEAVPLGDKTVTIVDEKNFGTFNSANNEIFYEFNEEGIWIISTIYSSISRETIRESSKYKVRNGYIFGIVLNDSLPCELEGERYYFGMRNKDQIIGGKTENVLKKINSNTYVINFKENGGFIPSLITFSGNNLSIQHFNYESGTNLFSSIKKTISKKVDGMNYITLSPSEKEWDEIDKALIYSSKINYTRIKQP
jgi:hypothetical protein